MASTSRPSLQLLTRAAICGQGQPTAAARRTYARQKMHHSPSILCACAFRTRSRIRESFANHCHQQHRHFADSKQNSDSTKILRANTSIIAEPTSISKPRNDSVHSKIHYILNKIRIGRLHDSKLADARAYISVASRWNNENGATLAEALLERLYEEQTIGRNSNVIIDSEMYNICMNGWIKIKCKNVDGETILRHVESILDRMEQRYARASGSDAGIDDADGGGTNNYFLARPDKFSYNCLINAYSKLENDRDSSSRTRKVEGILEKMNSLADAAAASGDVMDTQYEANIRPDEVTSNSLMNYYATQRDQHLSAQRAEDLLLHMSELSRQPGSDIQMKTISFNIVLKAWANSGGGMASAQRAESVLQRMNRLYSLGHDNVRPDTVSYSTVINAYSRVDPADGTIAVDSVMKILDAMEGSCIRESDKQIQSCYNAAANAIVKSGIPDAVDRVEALMDRMKNMDAVPASNMYISVIEAFANEGSDESFQRGRELLEEMMEEVVDHGQFVVPFNILLDSILKSKHVDRLDKAGALLKQMEEIGGSARPDLKSFSMIISALSRSSTMDLEQKAVEYLRQMQKSYREGHEPAKPDSFVFNCVISMLARSTQDWADDVIYRTLVAMDNQQKKGNKSVAPDTITYNLAIGKLAKSSTTGNAKKVMKLFIAMEESSALGKSSPIAPDIITYTNVVKLQEKLSPMIAADVASSCLKRVVSGRLRGVDQLGLRNLILALSKSHKFEHANIAREAWEFLEVSEKSKEEVILDSSLCNLVLICYNKSDMWEVAAEESLTFLSKQISQYKEGDETIIFPTVVGFSAAMASLGRANRLYDVARLLKIMKALNERGIPNVKPDEGVYVSILSALAKSQAENASTRAFTVIQWMKKDLGHISTASLNAAISTCSRARGSSADRKKALEVAFVLLKMGKESESCDAVTFGLMVKTCIRLAEDDNSRFKLVEVRHIHRSLFVEFFFELN